MADHGNHLDLDVFGGIAGDMFIAAALDAVPDLLEELQSVAAQIGPGVSLNQEKVKDHGLTGSHVTLTLPGKDRGPRHYGDYLATLIKSAPDRQVAERAADIIERLGKAEATVHGVPLERVHFHEISDWDSIADILLSAVFLERLHITSASVGPIPKGSGTVITEHGPLPIPAPATMRLLTGMTITDDGVAGERVTPTGAAILAHLAPTPRLPSSCVLNSSGYGFGTKRFKEIPNMLRFNYYESQRSATSDQVGVISFHVDDQTAEDLAVGLENIRDTSGVLDVLQWSAAGKKGRIATKIEVICHPGELEKVADRCFLETTTIGLRWRIESRRLLDRDLSGVRVGDAEFQTKTTSRPNGSHSVKPEMDELKRVEGHFEREKLRAQIVSTRAQSHKDIKPK